MISYSAAPGGFAAEDRAGLRTNLSCPQALEKARLAAWAQWASQGAQWARGTHKNCSLPCPLWHQGVGLAFHYNEKYQPSMPHTTLSWLLQIPHQWHTAKQCLNPHSNRMPPWSHLPWPGRNSLCHVLAATKPGSSKLLSESNELQFPRYTISSSQPLLQKAAGRSAT